MRCSPIHQPLAKYVNDYAIYKPKNHLNLISNKTPQHTHTLRGKKKNIQGSIDEMLQLRWVTRIY
ncbi:hypothetical protein OnM2_007020 [Erysiphe neolycopersici]|uniref:Uncharacterized protein n=1 Tax=Erysiphe neolycopersici TaxID=212602 RepID=A0A420I741_9PEZI|nr:hypothetical protein OnM2_007020 [Erysiphe neolycopersici]